jgi:hypothetical protein
MPFCLQCMSPEVARFRQADHGWTCPFIEAKRTCAPRIQNDAIDPHWTCVDPIGLMLAAGIIFPKSFVSAVGGPPSRRYAAHVGNSVSLLEGPRSVALR